MKILVTGGTKGIGLAIAKRLASMKSLVAGADDTLFLGYHADEAVALAAKAEVEAEGATVHLIRADVGTVEGATDIMAQIKDRAGALDHIVHSAAMIYPTTMLGADLGQFSKAVETNGLSLLYLVQKAQPLLGRGSSNCLHLKFGRPRGYAQIAIRRAWCGQSLGRNAHFISGAGARAAWHPHQCCCARPSPYAVRRPNGRQRGSSYRDC